MDTKYIEPIKSFRKDPTQLQKEIQGQARSARRNLQTIRSYNLISLNSVQVNFNLSNLERLTENNTKNISKEIEYINDLSCISEVKPHIFKVVDYYIKQLRLNKQIETKKELVLTMLKGQKQEAIDNAEMTDRVVKKIYIDPATQAQFMQQQGPQQPQYGSRAQFGQVQHLCFLDPFGNSNSLEGVGLIRWSIMKQLMNTNNCNTIEGLIEDFNKLVEEIGNQTKDNLQKLNGDILSMQIENEQGVQRVNKHQGEIKKLLLNITRSSQIDKLKRNFIEERFMELHKHLNNPSMLQGICDSITLTIFKYPEFQKAIFQKEQEDYREGVGSMDQELLKNSSTALFDRCLELSSPKVFKKLFSLQPQTLPEMCIARFRLYQTNINSIHAVQIASLLDQVLAVISGCLVSQKDFQVNLMSELSIALRVQNWRPQVGVRVILRFETQEQANYFVEQSLLEIETQKNSGLSGSEDKKTPPFTSMLEWSYLSESTISSCRSLSPNNQANLDLSYCHLNSIFENIINSTWAFLENQPSRDDIVSFLSMQVQAVNQKTEIIMNKFNEYYMKERSDSLNDKLIGLTCTKKNQTTIEEALDLAVQFQENNSKGTQQIIFQSSLDSSFITPSHVLTKFERQKLNEFKMTTLGYWMWPVLIEMGENFTRQSWQNYNPNLITPQGNKWGYNAAFEYVTPKLIPLLLNKGLPVSGAQDQGDRGYIVRDGEIDKLQTMDKDKYGRLKVNFRKHLKKNKKAFDKD